MKNSLKNTGRERIGIIGAGPAGLSAAEKLIKNKFVDISIFEKGRFLQSRICPVDIDKICSGCGGICNVISGVGGSMHYGDAIKLSKYPAGRRLKTFLKERYKHYEDQALDFFGVNSGQFHFTVPLAESFPGFRSYPVAEVPEISLEKLLDAKYSMLKNRVKFHLRTRVDSVEYCENAISVTYSKGSNVYVEKFDILVIATGRAGILDSKKWIDTLGIDTTTPSPSIGIRFELPTNILSPLFKIHRDFKFSESVGAYKVKSFCFSAHETQGGKIKYCHYQDQFQTPYIFLDGHMNHEKRSEDVKFGNFALLIQIANNSELFISNWLRLYSRKYHGKPFWQPLSALIDLPISHNGHKAPSVVDIASGDMRDLYPEDMLDTLISKFKDLARYISSFGNHSYEEVLTSTNLLAPAYEFFWNEPYLGENFEVAENIFIAGDAAGIAQGNLQAAIAGIVISDEILKRVNQNIDF